LTRFKFFRREIPVSPRARDRWLEAAVLGGLIGLFLAVAAVFPVVPGMIPESHVENVKLSLRVMQLLQEQSLWTLFIEGKLPASWSPSQPYQGALMAYLYLPVFYLVGANLAIAEYWHFLFVVPTLALVYFLMKQMFGRAATWPEPASACTSWATCISFPSVRCIFSTAGDRREERPISAWDSCCSEWE
jgi:hypothetical protein